MDWRRWHEEYRDPDSRLSRRLDVVRARLAEVLDACSDREVRLLSLCAGEARDVVPVLRDRPNARAVDAVVVELDEVLARRAGDTARAAGVEGDPRPQVRQWFAEAGMPELSFDGEPETYGVGVNRVEHASGRPLGDDRLFDFIR